MSDLDFCDDVKRSVTRWFHGHDMGRIERAVTLISERFADRPPDFMPREEWEARNRLAIDMFLGSFPCPAGVGSRRPAVRL
jgi:hypothetical protein